MRDGSVRADQTTLEVRELGVVGYREAYELQHRLADERAGGALDHDVLLLLEHPSTYTAGKRTEDSDLPTNGAPVIDVDRGGRITWHGPGQLVGYPIVRLAEPLDVVEYVRRIEEAIIAVCADLGVRTERVDGRSGVWVVDDAESASGQRKLGQIGIRVSRGVALHGFALNVDPDMSAFDAIVPCGIPDAGVTSLSLERGAALTITEVTPLIVHALHTALDHPDVAGSHDVASAPPHGSMGTGVGSIR